MLLKKNGCLLAVSSLILTACGGGDTQQSTQAPTVNQTEILLTADNSVKAVAGVLGATIGEANNVGALGSDMIAGVVQQNTSAYMGLVNLARAQLDLNANATQPALAGVLINKTENCEFGGSYTSNFDDKNGDGVLSSGEVDNRTFYGCVLTANAKALAGSVRVNLSSKSTNSNGGSLNAQLSLTFDNFSQGDKRIYGAMNLYISESANADVFAKVYGEKIVFVTNKGTTELKNFEQRLNVTSNTGIYSVVLSGDLAQTALNGAVKYAVTEGAPLLGNRNNQIDNLISGELILQGATNSKVKVSPIDTSSVKISVDSDGDGTFETTANKSWSEVSAVM